MQIKWIDQFNGTTGVTTKWLGISQKRALEMLQRHDPMGFRDKLIQLSLGREVATETYALRGEAHDKFDIWD